MRTFIQRTHPILVEIGLTVVVEPNAGNDMECCLANLDPKCKSSTVIILLTEFQATSPSHYVDERRKQLSVMHAVIYTMQVTKLTLHG